MSYISVQGLTKCYGDVTAVNDISFEVEKGEFVALLGPSGCGKSTTLMMLAGLEESSAGTIIFEGKDVTKAPPGKRGLSMVFQSYALFPHLTVQENILFGLKARKVSVEEQKKRLAEVLELVDLQVHIHKKPGQLSGGQCQRVALARAVVSHSPVCLMDEPLSNLDAKLRNEMRTEIRALQKKLGLTVIYVTHDQVEAMSMADRVILLNKGQIEQNGTPQSLYEDPESIFVASFIGQPPMNLLQDNDVILGVRPEHIQLAQQHGFSTTVINCDYHGANTLVAVEFRGHALKFMLQGHHTYSAGTPLSIKWGNQQEFYFSTKTGQRLANTTVHNLSEGMS